MARAAVTRVTWDSWLRKATGAALAMALLGVAGVTGWGAVSLPALAFEPPAVAQSASTVPLADLPREGQRTYQLILRGGPFAHDKDGAVFGNYERQLPPARRGYYHEYTVDTSGARGRGVRRIVCGGLPRTAPQACYYTGDHYSSFKKIMP